MRQLGVMFQIPDYLRPVSQSEHGQYPIKLVNIPLRMNKKTGHNNRTTKMDIFFLYMYIQVHCMRDLLMQRPGECMSSIVLQISN